MFKRFIEITCFAVFSLKNTLSNHLILLISLYVVLIESKLSIKNIE
jgi:hypothetical protein